MQIRQSFGFLRFAFGYIWKKTQTTQTQPSAAATRRSRSFHSRAAAAAALALLKSALLLNYVSGEEH